MHRGYLAALTAALIMLPAPGALLAADDYDRKMAACERLPTDDEKLTCFEALREELVSERARIEAELRRRGHEPKAPSCTIEDWRYAQYDDGHHIKLEGRASCRAGRLSFSLYDGDGEYLASDFTFIRGYVFSTYVEGQAPRNLRIKYDIEPR